MKNLNAEKGEGGRVKGETFARPLPLSLPPSPFPCSLPEYITAHLKTPFAYGVHDCVLFAVGWAELASGKQHLPKVTWTDEKSALRAIKKYVGAIHESPLLEAAFDKCFTRIAPNFAKDGDLALSGGIAYLFTGPHICGLGRDGLIFKSRMEAECAWTICRGDS